MELDGRKKKILKTIINEYVDTAEPVSSGSLIKKYPVNLSSATIRNEMLELEKLGYLKKPYSSSGRVPSELGYRYYVEKLISDDRLSVEDIAKIKEKLEKRAYNLEELTKLTCSTISEITHYTSIAIGPDKSNDKIDRIEFIRLKTNVIMVLIITDLGLVKESVIKFDQNISDETISELKILFTNKLVGHSLKIIEGSIDDYIIDEVNIGLDIIKKVIDEINNVIEENFIHIDQNMTQLGNPEFADNELREEYLRILKDPKVIVETIDDDNNDISIRIAGEKDGLENFSVISLRPKLNNIDIGTISVLAPKRMDYKKVVLTMKALLDELSSGLYDEDADEDI